MPIGTASKTSSPEACLGVGVCTSGHYVRTAKSPTIADIEALLTLYYWSLAKGFRQTAIIFPKHPLMHTPCAPNS